MPDVDEAISEAVEEAVEEALEDATPELAEEVAEEVAEETPEVVVVVEESPVAEINAALELDERIRAIAFEVASERVAEHEANWPHGETIIVEPEPEPEPVEEPEPEHHDEPPRVEHPWFRKLGSE